VYYGVKAALFLAAGTMAMCTKNDKRRDACAEIVRIVCRGGSPGIPSASAPQYPGRGGPGIPLASAPDLPVLS
jgi:hypothetical protein